MPTQAMPSQETPGQAAPPVPVAPAYPAVILPSHPLAEQPPPYPRAVHWRDRPARVAPCPPLGVPTGPFGRSWEGTVPLPPGIRVPDSGTAEEILEAFLRIPYRKDGAVSADGRHTLWADQTRTFKGPGLNCSGFMSAAARFLLGVNFDLDEVRRDVLADSLPGSPLGEDWDFGLDAALNLAGEGAAIFPWRGEYGRTEDASGRPLGLGADTDSPALEEALARLAPGGLYFFALSKPDRRFPGGLSYYHNGIALASPDGGVSLYHATAKAGVHRMRLGTPAGLATFRRYYPATRSGKRRIVFIEAGPPSCGPPPTLLDVGARHPPGALPGPEGAPGSAGPPQSAPPPEPPGRSPLSAPPGAPPNPAAPTLLPPPADPATRSQAPAAP